METGFAIFLFLMFIAVLMGSLPDPKKKRDPYVSQYKSVGIQSGKIKKTENVPLTNPIEPQPSLLKGLENGNLSPSYEEELHGALTCDPAYSHMLESPLNPTHPAYLLK